MKTQTSSLIRLHLGMFFMAFAPLFAKVIELQPAQVIFFRAAITALVLYLILLVSKQSVLLQRRRDYVVLLLIGCVMGIHWVFFFHSIQISTVAIGTIAAYTNPIMTNLLEPLFSPVKLDRMSVASAIVAFGGVVLIVPELSFSNSMTMGVFWGLLTALTYSLRNIWSRPYVKKYSGSLVMLYQMLAASALLLPSLWLWDLQMDQGTVVNVILLGVIATAAAHTLFISSLKGLKASTASVIATIGLPYSIVFALIFINEVPSPKEVLGALVIASIVVYEMSRHRVEEIDAPE